MEANKTHISLETAKLLRDCEVESEYIFVTINYEIRFPAYTWSEILWENAEKFFGEEYLDNEVKNIKRPRYVVISIKILYILQQKKYEEADDYFREHCLACQNK